MPAVIPNIPLCICENLNYFSTRLKVITSLKLLKSCIESLHNAIDDVDS